MVLSKIYWTCPDSAWLTICSTSINRCCHCRLRLGYAPLNTCQNWTEFFPFLCKAVEEKQEMCAVKVPLWRVTLSAAVPSDNNTAQNCSCRAGQSGLQTPIGAKAFSHHQKVQRRYWVHSDSYGKGTQESVPRWKRAPYPI